MPAAICDSVEKKPTPERAGGGAAGLVAPGGVPDGLPDDPPAPGGAAAFAAGALLSAGLPVAGFGVPADGTVADDFGVPDDGEAVSAAPFLAVPDGGSTDAILAAVDVSRGGGVDDAPVGFADGDAPDDAAAGAAPLPVDAALDVDAPASGLALSVCSFQPGAPFSVDVGAGLPSLADVVLRTSVAFRSSSGLGFLSADVAALPDLASALSPDLLLGVSFLSAMLLNPRTSNSLFVASTRPRSTCLAIGHYRHDGDFLVPAALGAVLFVPSTFAVQFSHVIVQSSLCSLHCLTPRRQSGPLIAQISTTAHSF